MVLPFVTQYPTMSKDSEEHPLLNRNKSFVKIRTVTFSSQRETLFIRDHFGMRKTVFTVLSRL